MFSILSGAWEGDRSAASPKERGFRSLGVIQPPAGPLPRPTTFLSTLHSHQPPFLYSVHKPSSPTLTLVTNSSSNSIWLCP